MFKRFLPISLLSFLCVVTINWGCTKLDTTSLGSDLIPAVDNISTFADTLDIISTQGVFGNNFNDSFKISSTENNVLGRIQSDVVFGTTEANIYLQPKPNFYPYYYGNAGDTLVGFDSLVLCLNLAGIWGDSLKTQTLNVFEITDPFFGDSAKQYYHSNPPLINNSPIGTRTIDITRVQNDSFKIAYGKDSVTKQIRIKLDAGFATRFFAQDSSQSGLANTLRNDTLFRKAFRGFAVKAGGTADALMYISLTDAKTRLEVHYRKKTVGTGKLDTSFNSLPIQTTLFGAGGIPSGTYNYIKRDYAGTDVATNPVSSDHIYLQTGPGTFANLKIPGLDTYTNRIIHRAQISIEQIPDVTAPGIRLDTVFSVPPYLYLDLVDTGALKWKPIYYDLNPSAAYDPDYKNGIPYFPSTGEIDYGYFGAYARKKDNALGISAYYYDINVTRYLQQFVTRQTPNYQMRLYAGFRTQYPQFGTASAPASLIPLSNPLAFGRIKVKSGAYPDKRVKMRMVVIWSKI